MKTQTIAGQERIMLLERTVAGWHVRNGMATHYANEIRQDAWEVFTLVRGDFKKHNVTTCSKEVAKKELLHRVI